MRTQYKSRTAVKINPLTYARIPSMVFPFKGEPWECEPHKRWRRKRGGGKRPYGKSTPIRTVRILYAYTLFFFPRGISFFISPLVSISFFSSLFYKLLPRFTLSFLAVPFFFSSFRPVTDVLFIQK